MRKSTAMITSLLALAGLTGADVSMAQQAPHQVKIEFHCPVISSTVSAEQLINYGSYIRGLGKEDISALHTRPMFSGPTPTGIPSNLQNGSYSSSGAMYNDSTGRVTCNYASSGTYKPFDVSYVMPQGKHGFILKTENSKITIILPTG